ncbi:MAG: ParA family protein [Proteobacteria bacterium]|nr:ParA family protein [Pseudomonadota bacterium]
MPPTVSFVNLKGGVGKTAVSVNFAAFCGLQELKTLLIDTDPQTNATFSCITVEKWKDHSTKKGTIANIMGMRRHTSPEGGEANVSEIIIRNVFRNVDLVPSHLDLFTIDLDLAATTARETKLKRSLGDILTQYKIVVCDCPPNLTIPTQNALAMSTHFAVPVSPDFLSAIGIGILLSRVKDFCKDLQHDLQHIGIILSRVGRPARHRSEISDDLRARFGELVITPEIKERAAVSEAASQNRSIYEMGDREAKKEFEDCSIEILKRMGEL